MATRAIGLDIVTTTVRAAQVSFDKRGTTLERFGQVALPPGAVRSGEVESPQIVAEALKALWSSAKFSTRNVSVGVASRRVVVRQVDLPAMPRNELHAALPFLVQDFIPMPVDSALLDMHVLEEIVSPAGAPMLRGLLVAASREMVEQTLEAVRLAGLKPVSVDLTPFAVLRALGQAEAPIDAVADAEVLVDIGASVTNIVVHQGGVPRFVRILLMGGGNATEAIAARLGISYEDAEYMKLHLSSGAPISTADQEAAAAALDQTTSAFCEEVRGSLNYFTAAHGAARMARVLISGGGAGLVGLADRLEQAIHVPVSEADPLPSLKVGKHVAAGTAACTVVPLGLALAVA